MKKLRLVAIALIACFSPVVLPQNTRAQTGAWEIPCVASGVCIAIGAYVAGGITYFILQNRRGKRWSVPAANGNLQNHAYPQVQPGPRPNRIGNPDEPYHSQIIDYVWGDSPGAAARRCQEIARQAGLRYVTVRRTSKTGNRWECHVDNL